MKTAVKVCHAEDCIHRTRNNGFGCALEAVVIGRGGKCRQKSKSLNRHPPERRRVKGAKDAKKT